jgi:hypothetical protein
MTPISKHFRGSLTAGATRNELYEVRPPNDSTGEPIFYLACVSLKSPLGLGPEHVRARVIAMGSAVDLLNNPAFEHYDPTAKRSPCCDAALTFYDGALGYESFTCTKCGKDVADVPPTAAELLEALEALIAPRIGSNKKAQLAAARQSARALIARAVKGAA